MMVARSGDQTSPAHRPCSVARCGMVKAEAPSMAARRALQQRANGRRRQSPFGKHAGHVITMRWACSTSAPARRKRIRHALAATDCLRPCADALRRMADRGLRRFGQAGIASPPRGHAYARRCVHRIGRHRRMGGLIIPALISPCISARGTSRSDAQGCAYDTQEHSARNCAPAFSLPKWQNGACTALSNDMTANAAPYGDNDTQGSHALGGSPG